MKKPVALREQVMWECHCIQSRFLQELKIFTCQTESWGMQMGGYCRGCATTLDAHRNSLYSFVRIHVPMSEDVSTLRGRNWWVSSFGKFVKMQHTLKKQILEWPPKYLHLLKMDQDQYSAFLRRRSLPHPRWLRSSWLKFHSWETLVRFNDRIL